VNTVYQEVAERIRGEVSDLARVIQRALQSWSRGEQLPDERDVYVESVALNLHGFYSGLERVFELIARHVDRSLPAGEGGHHDLLQQMTKEMAETRPAVISPESASMLDELRRFRHLVRNVYAFSLAPEKMEPLIAALPGLWQQAQAELSAFADFLEELAQANPT
jgi:hypothetical protein